jgi:hypothetical protein
VFFSLVGCGDGGGVGGGGLPHPHASPSVFILHLFQVRGAFSWVVLCPEVGLIFVFLYSVAFYAVLIAALQ